PGPGSQANTLDGVFVVADEHERRAPHELATLDLDRHRHAAVAAQDSIGCQHHGRPLAKAMPPQLFADVDDAWVDADRGVVDEHVIVHLTDVDAPDLSRGDGGDRLFDVERDV